MQEDNETKTLEQAKQKILEIYQDTQLSTKRPDKENSKTQDVDMFCLGINNEYVLEHTRIEPLNNYIYDGKKFIQDLGSLKNLTQ